MSWPVDLLVDDNWIAIFSLLPEVTTKLAISQVCKKWRGIILDPSFWKAVEVSIRKVGYRTIEDSYKKLVKFIQTHCPAVVDICIKVMNLEDLSENWLDPIFQITTLQRLAILFCAKDYSHSCLKYNTTKAPNCPDLRLLNVTGVKMKDDTLKILFSHMPNLEELYLCEHHKFSNSVLLALSKCKKLQRLAAPEGDLSADEAIFACPSLQYYIFYPRESEYDSDDSDYEETEKFSKIGNTLVVAADVLNLDTRNIDLDQLRLLKPLIMPYTCGTIIENVLVKLGFRDITDPLFTNGVLNFLLNEMHFDLNSRGPEYIYRQSFTSSDHSYRYGLLGKPKTVYLEKYPLEAVIHGRTSTGFGLMYPGQKPELVGLNYWLQLGAKAECPEPNRSYLTIAHRASVRLFLLQHGADPKKIINTKRKIPVFVYMFMDAQFEDSAEVVHALIDRGVDFSIEVGGKTALGWMIVNSMWKSFEALMRSGTKLSSADQFVLLKNDPNKFLERLATGVIDVMTLTVPVALQIINTGLGPHIAPYINTNINKMDENGYTLYHYMSMTSTAANLDNRICYKSDEDGNDFRWVLKDFKNCSWRDPKQIAKDEEGEEELEAMMVKEKEEEMKKQKLVFGQKNYQKILQNVRMTVVPQPQQIISTPQPAAAAFTKPNITILTKDGETGFLLVCKSRLTPDAMTKRVQHNLAANPDINRGDKNGWTPLHALCYGQYWQAALQLVTNGANINAQDNHGVTPLMAAIYGYKHLPESLPYPPNVFTDNFCALITASKDPLDVNAVDKFSNRSLLHLAVSIDDPRLVLELIKLKCNVNARDSDGYTPLHIAAMVGARANVIETLVKNGADVNAQTNSLRLTPAMVYMHIMAAFRTSTYTYDIPQNLLYFIHLERCSNMMRGNRYYREVIVDKSRVAVLLEAPWHNHKNTFGKDEHISTEKFYDCDAVFEALTRGADLTLTDVNNFNYLHFLVMMCGDNYQALLRVVQNPPVNQLWNAKNNFKTSPFLELCVQFTQNTERSHTNPEPKKLHDNMFLYELVIKYNINVMECDHYGMFPFYYITSAKWTHFNLEKWTALPGVDLSVEIPEKATLFDKLRRKDLVNASMLRETIAKSPSFLHRQDPCGATFLIQLVEEICFGGYNHQEFLEIILQDKSHINIQDVNGNTALHIACQFFNLGAVDSIRFNLQNLSSTYPLFVTPFLLLDAGADPSIKNNRGETPLTYVPLLMSHYQRLYQWVKEKAGTKPATKTVEEQTTKQDVNKEDEENSMSDA